MKKGPKPKALAERFWPKVAIGDPGECWEWRGQRDAKGYGRLRGAPVNGHRGRPQVATRLAWELDRGSPIPIGLCALHRCDNPPCVNPRHLFLGTLGDNNRDAKSKGRNAAGTRNGMAKLNEAAVTAIRHRIADGELQKDLASEFGISKQLVSVIKQRKLWKQAS